MEPKPTRVFNYVLILVGREAEYKYETKFTFKRELQINVLELILRYLLIECIIIYCIAVSFNNYCRLRTKGDISKIVYGLKIDSEVI